ncbi:DUF4231 domain-containing protein [Streptomyces sp. TLI_185]|uniref:DUF4231 domain-containing protein n=1 Tax=Streptomyces sp. TLI_185 TaxID=2485151 RepID=UPI000F4FC24E|nr:DUF4231 domain-containing protein [Streptomyces sp. TLI_185]RPF38219.1 uncharacterized protein DUF4231 [Streptomyces sp. TLI_185]
MRRRTVTDRDWSAAPDPVLALAQQDLAFYARTRDRSRRMHYVTELGALAATSSTVVAAGLHAPAWLTALIAGGAVFFTGVRQLFSPAARWVVTGQSHETLRRAVDRYRLLPPADRDAAARAALQATVEEVGNNELREWSDTQGQTQGQARAQGAAPPSA